MVEQEMGVVERVAALLEGIDAGLVQPGDAATIAVEMVALVRVLAAEPRGWTADLGHLLLGQEIPRSRSNTKPPARRAAGS